MDLRRLAVILLFALAASRASGAPDYYAAESVLLFADHLYRLGEHSRAAAEYERYLFLASLEAPQEASIRFRIAESLRCAGQFDRSLAIFHDLLAQEAPGAAREAVVYGIAFDYLLMERYQQSLEALASFPPERLGQYRPAYCLLEGMDLMFLGRWRQAHGVLAGCPAAGAEGLKAIAARALSVRPKSPALAGVLSGLLPGSGKIYAGESGDGVQAFFLIGLLAALSAFGFHSEGPDSVRGWIYLSLGGLFYAGNIYGSVTAASRYNKRMKETLLDELKRHIPPCGEPARFP